MVGVVVLDDTDTDADVEDGVEDAEDEDGVEDDGGVLELVDDVLPVAGVDEGVCEWCEDEDPNNPQPDSKVIPLTLATKTNERSRIDLFSF